MKKSSTGKGAAAYERLVYDYKRAGRSGAEPLRVALGFPSSYAAGMSNLGFLWVYHILNSGDGVLCDRFFFPESAEDFRGKVSSFESGRPIASYDVVAFSLPYEADYPKMAWLLKRGGIELFSEDREGLPLVLAGGVAVSSNPEPVADFLDAVVVGEVEAISEKLIDALKRAMDEAPDRGTALEYLAAAGGVYVPSFYSVEYSGDGTVKSISPETAVVAQRIERITEPAHSPIVSDAAVFSGMYLVEMSRGCPHKCRFCLTSSIGRGFRAAEEEALLKAVRRGLEVSKRIGLIGTAFAEAAAMDSVYAEAESAGARVSFSSLRLNAKVISMLRRWSGVIDNETLAVAPEVATGKLRNVVNKDLGESVDELLDGELPEGLRALKFYYLVGVPGEENEDIEAIVSEMKRAREKASRRGLKVSLSVNPLVPKAQTAFQWLAGCGTVEVKSKLSVIKQGLSGRGGVPVSGMSAREAEIQTTLSLGDRRLGRVIADVADAGCGTSALPAAMRDRGLDIGFYARRERGRDEILPWSVVDHGVPPAALWKSRLDIAKAACGGAV